MIETVFPAIPSTWIVTVAVSPTSISATTDIEMESCNPPALGFNPFVVRYVRLLVMMRRLVRVAAVDKALNDTTAFS